MTAYCTCLLIIIIITTSLPLPLLSHRHHYHKITVIINSTTIISSGGCASFGWVSSLSSITGESPPTLPCAPATSLGSHGSSLDDNYCMYALVDHQHYTVINKMAALVRMHDSSCSISSIDNTWYDAMILQLCSLWSIVRLPRRSLRLLWTAHLRTQYHPHGETHGWMHAWMGGCICIYCWNDGFG